MRIALTVGLGLALLGAASAAAQEPTTEQGQKLYTRYCAACHGPAGEGDGFVSGFLRPKASDLTIIAKKAEDGEFPFRRVMRQIDGRDTVEAHGRPEQPVWGEILKEQAPAEGAVERAEVEGKIFMITEYLKSIQKK